MILKYWRPEAAVDVDAIQQELYAKEAGGIYARDMAKYFETHGYRTFAFRAEWSDLEEHLAKGRPLIVCLERNQRGVPLHYVVVAGIDSVSELVLVNDPAQRKLLSMPRAQFEQSWRATNNWTLLAVPELDLAGEAFRERNLSETLEHLDSAIRVNPDDAHTNDFLATVYFLQDNTEAALQHWNRAGKPKIENIRIDPPLHTDPVLLDRAFAFSRGSVLHLSDFEETQSKLSALRVFSRYRMELSPAGEEGFDLTLRAAERNGTSVWAWARGLPFQSVQPEFSNIGGKAVHVGSTLRWDPNKRRAFLSFETPLGGTPAWGILLSMDGRSENWASTDGGFHMRKVQALAELRAVPSGRWSWTSGGSVSSRSFSNSFSSGVDLKYSGSVKRTWLRDPRRHLDLKSSLQVEAGKFWTANPSRFAKAVTSTQFRWHSLTSELRLGSTAGRLPFDERFIIGLERDSDLWLRAHPATVDGRKNASNSSRSFVITNWDVQKTVFNGPWFRISSGPFFDAGKSSLASHWILDAGAELRFSILESVGVSLSFGKSLSDARSSVFVRQHGL